MGAHRPGHPLNDREFFSVRIDTKSIVRSPAYQIDLGKLALK